MRRENSIPELVELRIRINGRDEPSHHVPVNAELRIGLAEIETDEGIVAVGLRRAMLNLYLDGMEVAPGPRLGEPIRKSTTITRTLETAQTDQRTGRQAGIAAKAGLSEMQAAPASLDATLGFSFEDDQHLATKAETASERVHYPVKAQGNDCWLVSERGGPLDGTYLADDKLCSLQRISGANRHAVNLSVEARQRDLAFGYQQVTKLGRLLLTKRKLTNIVLAKSLTSWGRTYEGRVLLSVSESEYEG